MKEEIEERRKSEFDDFPMISTGLFEKIKVFASLKTIALSQ